MKKFLKILMFWLNLHSTMVLFKYGIGGCLDTVSKFTFHYGPIQMYKIICTYYGSLEIYIPLWSYSNGTTIIVMPGVVVFTFHYGPIQMLCINY